MLSGNCTPNKLYSWNSRYIVHIQSIKPMPIGEIDFTEEIH